MDTNTIGNCDFFVSNDNISPTPNLNIYPNPVDNYLFIELENTNFKNAQLQLYDIVGKQIQGYAISKSLEKIDLRNIPKGMYMYSVIQDDIVTKVGKIIKE